MPLMQLIYASRPFGYDDLTLSGILASAQHNNRRDSVTGALICREDVFVQMLEGLPEVVSPLFARIQRDDRHTEVHMLQSREIEHRLFPDWAMRHDPARSWMWTPEQVVAGAIENATPEDALALFERLAADPPTTPQMCPANDAV